MNKTIDFNASWLSERSEYFDRVYNDIKRLKEKDVFANKRIAIVGVWLNMAEINEIIRRLDMTISIIADNNPNKQGISKLGIISQSVKSLVNENNVIILVINNIYWRDIQLQLQNLGFVKNIDFFVIFGSKKAKLGREKVKEPPIISARIWNKLCSYANKGFASYIKLAQKYPELPIWLMHQPSLGDLYIFALFLPAAMGETCISDCKCVLIVTKNSVKKLAETLGFKNIVLISYDDAHHKWLTVMKLMGDTLNVRNAVHHGLNNVFVSLILNTQVTFSDGFKKYVFQFVKEVKPIYPLFPKRKEYVLAQFREYGLKPGKTVVISPYAGHFIAQINKEHWIKLISRLTAKGFTVCTNCGSPEESPLPGTKAPFIELQDCVEFVETAGYFIGVRSGFCDLVCMANCKKIVIYETGAPAASIDFFGFKSMGIGENIIELVNDCIHVDDLIENIIDRLEIL